MAAILQQQSDSADYSVVAVPASQRMNKGSLTMAWWGICSAMFWLVVSATLAMTFGTKNAIIGLLLSVVTYAAINGIIARYAIKTGLSVALFSRVLFGRKGAVLATLIFFATATYYSVFEGSVIAIAIQQYVPNLSLNQAYLLVVLYSVPLILGRVQSWMDKLNGVLLPFYLIGLVALVALTIERYGYSTAWLQMGPASGPVEHGWWNCFSYFMGVWILMMYTWDYARFGRKEDAGYHGRFNFGLPFYTFTFLINGLVGIFLAGTIPTSAGLSEVSVVMAIIELMGIWGLIFVWISQTRINSANFYLAATNMQAFFGGMELAKVPYAVWAVAVGALVYTLMRLNVFEYILQALAYQSIFIVAWVAIALAHIFSPRYNQLFQDRIEYQVDRVSAFNPCGLGAWFFAAAAGIALLNSGHPALATWSAPVTFISAFGAYWLLLNNARRSWFVRANYT
ncbi:purine-cytosine permease family protein [Pseudomonas sp. NPDC089569]|uniref:purine-cytosine permease family protein n=1 Tax=Pseudomonas sp. NPDC089569 TaxID=3390722 RepID=UPI003CFBD859